MEQRSHEVDPMNAESAAVESDELTDEDLSTAAGGGVTVNVNSSTLGRF